MQYGAENIDFILISACLLTLVFFIYLKKQKPNLSPVTISQLETPPASPDNLIRSAIVNIWATSEEYVQEFYERLEEHSFQTSEELCQYILSTHNDAVSGQFLGYKMIRPFDLTIWVVDAEHKVLYHPIDYLIGSKLNASGRYENVFKKDRGEFIILDHYRSRQFERFAKKSLKSNRLSKVYFAKFKELSAIVIFENHVNLVNKIRQTNLQQPNRIRKTLAGGTPSSYSLEITKAVYKGKTEELDVTEKLRQKVINDTLDLEVTNKLFGDPDPGYIKSLEISYRINQTEFLATFNEGEKLFLP